MNVALVGCIIIEVMIVNFLVRLCSAVVQCLARLSTLEVFHNSCKILSMPVQVISEYLSIGGNRQSAASAWSRHSAVLAFGADQNVAIWRPVSQEKSGIQDLLHGHKRRVTAIAFCQSGPSDAEEWLLSGSADGHLLLWTSENDKWRKVTDAKAHQGSINTIIALEGSMLVVTGGSNAEIKIWKARNDHLEVVTTIHPRTKIIPLTLAIGTFPTISSNKGVFLVVGGTRNEIQLYVIDDVSSSTPTVEHQATLKGHEGWIRSLALRKSDDNELLLASASADKYVRLWKFQNVRGSLALQSPTVESVNSHGQILSAKKQTISIGEERYSITFEALLLGHEDWVYSVAWNTKNQSDQLLSASADGSLTIWEPDPASGIWISASRLGEISGQKGATTATGSAGGFWTGLWSPDGSAVACLGRTGSWRLWEYSGSSGYWVQTTGLSGHTASVNSITWPAFGEYLISTSSDQTTRLHAEWRRDSTITWHEFSRPQIHGYDLNCLASTKNYQFVSGADEKLLRVFNEPKDIAGMLHSLCSIKEPINRDLPEMAAIPVLGLSNKAVGEEDDSMNDVNGRRDQDYVAPSALDTSLTNITEPPTEDILARHTLWPEHEKLYGHGYEISECASSGDYLATACKASSTDHAVIRLYNTKTWTEIKPALAAHSLTVTRLTWSFGPDLYLLSVGRDRQWAIFSRGADEKDFGLIQSNPKAHARMILDAAWSPIGGQKFFATAARDKTVKIWHWEYQGNHSDQDVFFTEWETIKRDTSATAVAFTCDRGESFAILAVGEESGMISLHVLNIDRHLSLVRSMNLPVDKCPSKAVNRLAWRNNANQYARAGTGQHLAVAASDGSLRILAIDVEELCARL